MFSYETLPKNIDKINWKWNLNPYFDIYTCLSLWTVVYVVTNRTGSVCYKTSIYEYIQNIKNF